jgi:hypothetical protein
MNTPLTFFLIICIFATGIVARDYESSPLIDRQIASARNFVAAYAQQNASALKVRTMRTTLTNPDPSHILINANTGKVTLLPYGLGATPAKDTANLEWVLNHYSDIKLVTGTYHLDRTIEIVNFQGKIKGAGVDKTFIVGRGPLENGEYIFPYLNEDLSERIYPSTAPHLMWFRTASFADPNDWINNLIDLDMKDLTMRLDGLGPIITIYQQPLRSIWFFLAVSGPNASYTVPGGNVVSVKVSLKNIDFLAQKNTYTLDGVTRSDSNAAATLIVYGGELWTTALDQLSGWAEVNHAPINAQIDIKNCNFVNFHQFALGLEGLSTADPGGDYTYPTDPLFPRSTVTVKDNVYTNCGNGAGLIGTGGYTNLLLGNSDTDMIFSDNRFINNPAIAVAVLGGISEDLLKLPLEIKIKDNYFHQVGGQYEAPAILIIDISGFTTGNVNVTVIDNEFVGDNGYAQYQILSAMSRNLLVKDNVFSGTGLGAVAISPANIFDPSQPPMPSVGAVIKNNDIDNLTAYAPKILLGGGANFCTVYVDNAADAVDVNGPSSTNTIIVA